jgi:hypothetical protein
MLTIRFSKNENESIMVTNAFSEKRPKKVQWPRPFLDIYFCPKSKNGMTFWTEKTSIFHVFPLIFRELRPYIIWFPPLVDNLFGIIMVTLWIPDLVGRGQRRLLPKSCDHLWCKMRNRSALKVRGHQGLQWGHN